MCSSSKGCTKFRTSSPSACPSPPSLLHPRSSQRGAGPRRMPSCPSERQLLKKRSQKKQPIKTETAVTILHSVILISLSFVFLPLFACSVSLSPAPLFIYYTFSVGARNGARDPSFPRLPAAVTQNRGTSPF